MSGTRSLTRTPAKAKRPSRAATLERGAHEVIGLPPRVDLLPKEVRDRAKVRGVRSALILGALIALIVVGGGYAVAGFIAAQSAAAFEAEQARTLDLLAQQQAYVEVRQVQTRVVTSGSATRVAQSAEIDWQAFTGKIQAVLPAGVTLTAMTTVGASPVKAFPLPTDPLVNPSIASVVYTSRSSGLPDTSAWIDNVRRISGVSDVTVTRIEQADGVYSIDLMVHLDLDAIIVREPDAETEETK